MIAVRQVLALVTLAVSAWAQPGEFRLRNGLRVLLVERRDQVVLRLHLLAGRAPGGAMETPAAALRSHLASVGAGGMTRALLDRRLAERGIGLTVDSTPRGLEWSLVAEDQDLEEAFELLGHVVLRPRLEELPETKDSGTGLGLLERFAWHRYLVRPEQSVLVIQGDLSLAQARQQALLHLGTWAPAPEPPPASAVGTPTPSGSPSAFSPEPGGTPRDRAPHLALSLLLERDFRSDPDVVFETTRHRGDTGAFLFRLSPGSTAKLRQRVSEWSERAVTEADLAYVRSRWAAERATRVLHPREQLAALAWEALQGDPGVHLSELRPQEVTAARRSRLGGLVFQD